MRDSRSTTNTVGLLAIILLIGFALSFCAAVRQDGLSEVCGTWVILPLLGITVIVCRGRRVS